MELPLALQPDLDRYYYDNVIGGPGAFMVPAMSYDTFADAILKKLITEIAGPAPKTLITKPTSASASTLPAASMRCALVALGPSRSVAMWARELNTV